MQWQKKAHNTLPAASISPTTKFYLSTTNAKEKLNQEELNQKRSLEWDKRVLLVLEKRKNLSLSSSLSLFQPIQHKFMDSFKLTCVTKDKLTTLTQGAKCWGTTFSLMPHAPILFNHFYLFTKKYQNITLKLFWASMNISHPIGLQIFPISLSIIGHYFSKKKKRQMCDPNIFIFKKNIVLLIIWSHVTWGLNVSFFLHQILFKYHLFIFIHR